MIMVLKKNDSRSLKIGPGGGCFFLALMPVRYAFSTVLRWMLN
jgi:hypothetical protein